MPAFQFVDLPIDIVRRVLENLTPGQVSLLDSAMCSSQREVVWLPALRGFRFTPGRSFYPDDYDEAYHGGDSNSFMRDCRNTSRVVLNWLWSRYMSAGAICTSSSELLHFVSNIPLDQRSKPLNVQSLRLSCSFRAPITIDEWNSIWSCVSATDVHLDLKNITTVATPENWVRHSQPWGRLRSLEISDLVHPALLLEILDNCRDTLECLHFVSKNGIIEGNEELHSNHSSSLIEWPMLKTLELSLYKETLTGFVNRFLCSCLQRATGLTRLSFDYNTSGGLSIEFTQALLTYQLWRPRSHILTIQIDTDTDIVSDELMAIPSANRPWITDNPPITNWNIAMFRNGGIDTPYIWGEFADLLPQDQQRIEYLFQEPGMEDSIVYFPESWFRGTECITVRCPYREEAPEIPWELLWSSSESLRYVKLYFECAQAFQLEPLVESFQIVPEKPSPLKTFILRGDEHVLLRVTESRTIATGIMRCFSRTLTRVQLHCMQLSSNMVIELIARSHALESLSVQFITKFNKNPPAGLRSLARSAGSRNQPRPVDRSLSIGVIMPEALSEFGDVWIAIRRIAKQWRQGISSYRNSRFVMKVCFGGHTSHARAEHVEAAKATLADLPFIKYSSEPFY